MNVDEAIEIATSTAITLTKLEMAEVAEVLAAEVKRLRKEVAKLQAQLHPAATAAMVELKHTLDNTAKAQQKKG